MKGAFRRSMSWLHTWMGLALGWLLFFIFLTGTISYFHPEIGRWMQPELPMTAQHVPQEELIETAFEHLEKLSPAGSTEWRIMLPAGRVDMLQISWREPPVEEGRRGSRQQEFIDHETNQIVAEVRDTGGGRALYRFHYRLHYIPEDVATWIVGFATMFMLLALVTGIIIHIRIFKDFFTFRPKLGPKSWLDAHVVVGVVALPFHLMITYSGLVFFVFAYMSMVPTANYGADGIEVFEEEVSPEDDSVKMTGIEAPLVNIMPLIAEAKKYFGDDKITRITIRNPNDKSAIIYFQRGTTTLFDDDSIDEIHFNGVTGSPLPIANLKPASAQAESVLLALHEGQFAGIIMRWFYFIVGILSTMVIATGMLLWVEKRRFKYENKQAPSNGYLLVQRLNAGTIVGLPMAIAVYFIANRLLPVDIASRASWEINILFISLGLFMLYPFLRPLKKIWVEMLAGAAILYLAIPIINALTTDKHMLATALAKDWTLFSFDLTIILFAMFFAFAALRVQQRKSQPVKKKSIAKSRKVLNPTITTIATKETSLTK